MTQVLNLNAARVFNKKISINVLNKDAENTIFTLSLEGLEFNREQLNEFMGPFTFESWYNQGSDGVWRPMQWWERQKSPDYRIADEFDCESALIVVDDSHRLEFETAEADEDNEDAEDIPAAHISAIVLTPTAGGVTKVAFHMQVRPGLGETNTTLQEYQYRWISVTLSETKLAQRKGTQQSLPLEQPQGEPSRPVSGGFEPSKTAEQIDADMRANHPGAEESVVYANTAEGEEMRQADEASATPPPAPTPEELAEIERNVQAQVAAFNARPGEVIDGRSERVRHLDEQRAKRGAA